MTPSHPICTGLLQPATEPILCISHIKKSNNSTWYCTILLFTMASTKYADVWGVTLKRLDQNYSVQRNPLVFDLRKWFIVLDLERFRQEFYSENSAQRIHRGDWHTGAISCHDTLTKCLDSTEDLLIRKTPGSHWIIPQLQSVSVVSESPENKSKSNASLQGFYSPCWRTEFYWLSYKIETRDIFGLNVYVNQGTFIFYGEIMTD